MQDELDEVSAVERLRKLLRSYTPEERYARMTPGRRALFDEIRRLRDEIGPIDFDVVEELRKLRDAP